MTTKQITRTLDAHSVPYFIRNDGHVIADSMEGFTDLFQNTEDVTTWTRAQLYSWLGY